MAGRRFQSTPSARRATTVGGACDGQIVVFQSTPSARRATEHAVRRNGRKEISIHALREEGDHGPGHRRSLPPDFNPRPPRGGRPSAAFSARFRSLFQSTPSARRATDGFQLGGPALEISIHALREEGDTVPSSETTSVEDFNPRPPRGGRPRQAAASVPQCGFQSTPSARRATRRPGRKPGSCAISIHALREEGDLQSGMWSMANTIFQSTPSARRATQPPEFVLLVFIVFQSTPSARRATHL